MKSALLFADSKRLLESKLDARHATSHIHKNGEGRFQQTLDLGYLDPEGTFQSLTAEDRRAVLALAAYAYRRLRLT